MRYYDINVLLLYYNFLASMIARDSEPQDSFGQPCRNFAERNLGTGLLAVYNVPTK